MYLNIERESNHVVERDYFGSVVSMDNNYIILGSPIDSLGSNLNIGAAYIFKKNDNNENWIFIEKITASDAVIYDTFGYSVDITNNYAIIGAYLSDPNGLYKSGSAYIFKRKFINNKERWIEEKKIVPFDYTPYDSFGYSVSINNRYAIVGSYQSGSAYVYYRDENNNNNNME